MLINPHDGAIKLPNSISIHSELTQDAMLADPLLADAKRKDYGALPWIHHHFCGGEIEGKPLRASVCFYDQLLVFVTLAADLYPPDPKDWSSYSLEVEAQTKRFHDALLTGELGPPTHIEHFLSHDPSGPADTLNRPHRWDYAWGRVWSSHDFKGGGTSIVVRYGNRLEDANAHYRSTQPGSGMT
jgi:hypothetical protein